MGSRHPQQERASVTFAHGPTELECLLPAWDELAGFALEPNPFYESWMLLPALRAYGAGQDICVALVWAGDKLAGLFPFARAARYKGLPLAALSSWRHAHCLLGTPLVRADCANLCLGALFDAVDASLIEFSYLPAGEPFHRELAEVLGARGLRAIVNRSYERGLLRKHRGTVSGQLRRRMAKSERLLGKHGALAYVELGAQDDVAPWIAQFLELEAGGWKGREGSAMASSPANRAYFAQILEAAHRRGRLIACGLDVGGKPIARRFSFLAGEGAYAFKIAHDEEFREASPGVLLEHYNLRQVDADPRIEWMDSFTDSANLAVERMWPDRRRMETLAAATGAWGGLAVAALPALRWLKHRLG